MQVTKGFHLGLDTEPRTLSVKLPVILQYRDMDCSGGMNRGGAKVTMTQKSDVGVIQRVMVIHDHFPACCHAINAMLL